MNPRFSKHAKDRVTDRQIPENLVLEIISNPDTIETDSNNLTVYAKLVIDSNKKYLYRVFVNTTKEPPLIVTVYKTSKYNRYGY